MADGLASGPAAADSPKHFAYQPLDARRCALAKSQDHIDLGDRRPLPLAPDMAIDRCAQGAVSRWRLFLSLTRPTIGLVRHGIDHVRTGFDPVATLGNRLGHATSREQMRGPRPPMSGSALRPIRAMDVPKRNHVMAGIYGAWLVVLTSTLSSG